MIVSGYISENRFSGLRLGDEKRLTHVNFAFAVVKDGNGSVDHWENTEAVRAFLKNKGSIKALLSVGGWGAGGFSPAVATAEGREKFAQSLVDIMDDFGFDGIDLDWEYPCDGIAGIEFSPEDKPNFTLAVKLLREKMGSGKVLSMAAGALQSCVDNLEIDKLVGPMDLFNIMTYDMASWSCTGHHTSLYESDISHSMCGDKAIRMYEKAGVPHEKLTLGSAFYARVYSSVYGMNVPSDGNPPGFSGGFADTMSRVKAAGGISYDEKAEAPYACDVAKKSFITFDNERSIKAKREYVKSKGLAGIMFWEYSCDDDGTLLKAMTE